MPVSPRLALPALPALIAVSALGLAACGDGGSGASTGQAGASGDGAITVVSATNVYGGIAAAVGGDDVEVTSIVDSLSQDPHSYEPTVQDKLAVSGADLVIENGGGYDAFLGRLADETGVETVLNAVELSGLEEPAGTGEHPEEDHAEEGHGHGAFNEHVWYDLSAMATLADAIAEELSRIDASNADAYRQRADAFVEDLRPVQDRLAALASENGNDGVRVAVTEPVPAYLLEAAGLEDVTPEAFTQAIEEESDVPVAALEEMKSLVSGGSLAFLAYNGQTEGAQTEAVRSDAGEAGLPVVEFTETLPDGEDYVSWMAGNAESIEAALAS
ncbi:zinc/manganese transport system substrate-binding protein [Arthrobacter sp. CAN_A2]|uniref:metal ABC transporter solute-binding protein, Zn/Mn family n=1 Tax=Arthrobacter sp. CAN_A2 TaxID=2787718 RepID=UPI0018F009AA